jgi:uncharacterized integral membrane protein (TIGR00698 family)
LKTYIENTFRLISRYAPGVIGVLLISFVSLWIGNVLPIIGGVVAALVMGILIRNGFGIHQLWIPGVSFIDERALKLAIICFGAGLSIEQVMSVGYEAFFIIFVTIILTLILVIGLGKLLGLNDELTQLIGVGNAICGGTAIAATSPVIKAKEEMVAYAISVVFLFNMIAIFVYPALGHWMNMTDKAFGIWVGTAIQDTSSVIAAGFIYSEEAGTTATIVKLTRTLFLIPVLIGFSVFYHLKQNKKSQEDTSRDRFSFSLLTSAFPIFILGFFAMASINSLGFVPKEITQGITTVGKFLIIMGLAAIGLGLDLKKIIQTGIKPLLLGLVAALTISLSSLLMIHLFIQ